MRTALLEMLDAQRTGSCSCPVESGKRSGNAQERRGTSHLLSEAPRPLATGRACPGRAHGKGREEVCAGAWGTPVSKGTKEGAGSWGPQSSCQTAGRRSRRPGPREPGQRGCRRGWCPRRQRQRGPWHEDPSEATGSGSGDSRGRFPRLQETCELRNEDVETICGRGRGGVRKPLKHKAGGTARTRRDLVGPGRGLPGKNESWAPDGREASRKKPWAGRWGRGQRPGAEAEGRGPREGPGSTSHRARGGRESGCTPVPVSSGQKWGPGLWARRLCRLEEGPV